jgi:hypothetical protein
MGELSHFTRANKPHGAPKRCIDGCPVAVSCPYNALAIYAGRASGEFPRNIVEMIDPQSELLDKLAESNYINCVYQCDNDVADHQVVNMLYEGGCTVSLNITAFTDRITRKIIIMGPNGQITGDMEGNFIECVDFATMKKETIHLDVPGAGHSGGDAGLMRCFLSQVRDGNGDITTTINNSLDSHLMAFAAEKARKSAKVIAYQECRNAFLGL